MRPKWGGVRRGPAARVGREGRGRGGGQPWARERVSWSVGLVRRTTPRALRTEPGGVPGRLAGGTGDQRRRVQTPRADENEPTGGGGAGELGAGLGVAGAGPTLLHARGVEDRGAGTGRPLQAPSPERPRRASGSRMGRPGDGLVVGRAGAARRPEAGHGGKTRPTPRLDGTWDRRRKPGVPTRRAKVPKGAGAPARLPPGPRLANRRSRSTRDPYHPPRGGVGATPLSPYQESTAAPTRSRDER